MTQNSSWLSTLYQNAKKSAKSQLGGEQAYWVVGPTIRRMAVSGAILQILVQQDEIISDPVVRKLLNTLYDLLTDDIDFQTKG